ncbi:hypothetical protein [Micromonospora sp. NPDC023888]
MTITAIAVVRRGAIANFNRQQSASRRPASPPAAASAIGHRHA